MLSSTMYHDDQPAIAMLRGITHHQSPPLAPPVSTLIRSQSNVSTTHTTPLRAHPRHKNSMGRGKRKKYGGDAEKDKLDGETHTSATSTAMAAPRIIIAWFAECACAMWCPRGRKDTLSSPAEQNRTEILLSTKKNRTEFYESSRMCVCVYELVCVCMASSRV